MAATLLPKPVPTGRAAGRHPARTHKDSTPHPPAACGPGPSSSAAAAARPIGGAARQSTLPPCLLPALARPRKPHMRYVGRRGPAAVSTDTAAEGAQEPGLLSPAILSPGGSGPTLTLPPPPAITRPDAAFEADGLAFVWGLDGLDLGDLNDLFEKVGFPRRDPARLAAALARSHSVLWVRATRGGRWARAGQLLGFARSTSDGALAATVWDVAVSPAWQRGGLGRALVERLTAGLVRDDGIPTVTLYAEPGVVGWYERCGFAPDPGGAKGMAFQKTSAAGAALVRRALGRGAGGGAAAA